MSQNNRVLDRGYFVVLLFPFQEKKQRYNNLYFLFQEKDYSKISVVRTQKKPKQKQQGVSIGWRSHLLEVLTQTFFCFVISFSNKKQKYNNLYFLFQGKDYL